MDIKRMETNVLKASDCKFEDESNVKEFVQYSSNYTNKEKVNLYLKLSG